MPYFSETISKISDPYAFNIVNLEPPSTIVKYQMPLTYELATNSDISMHEEYFRGNKLIIQRNSESSPRRRTVIEGVQQAGEHQHPHLLF